MHAFAYWNFTNNQIKNVTTLIITKRSEKFPVIRFDTLSTRPSNHAGNVSVKILVQVDQTAYVYIKNDRTQPDCNLRRTPDNLNTTLLMLFFLSV